MATINDIREEVAKNQNNLTQILKYTNATPILRQSEIGYVCYFCNKHCLDPASLKIHCLESHGNGKPAAHMRQKNISFYVKLDITGLTCNICKKNINTLEQLYKHLKREHQKKIFTDHKNLIIPFKFEAETLSCYMCFNIFDKFKKLMEHMHTHYGNYMCDICRVGFVTHGSLVSHSECHKVGTFQCDICNKPFNTMYKKNSHVKNVHKPKTERFRCAFCTEKFTEAQKRNVHLSKIHGITSHHIKCRSCDKTFSSKWSMTLHTRRQHLMEKRFKCPNCEMMFFSADELNKHGLKHSGVKEFKCDICSKSYARRTTLIEHMRIHNDDRRFKCNHCGQAFVQKCSWKGHMKNKHGQIVL